MVGDTVRNGSARRGPRDALRARPGFARAGYASALRTEATSSTHRTSGCDGYLSMRTIRQQSSTSRLLASSRFVTRVAAVSIRPEARTTRRPIFGWRHSIARFVLALVKPEASISTGAMLDQQHEASPGAGDLALRVSVSRTDSPAGRPSDYAHRRWTGRCCPCYKGAWRSYATFCASRAKPGTQPPRSPARLSR